MPSLDELAGAHRTIFENLYREMDPYEKGRIAANEAATFMKRSNLGLATLGKIWEFADHSKIGILDKYGAFLALKLIAIAQQGGEISAANLSADSGPPTLASRAATPSLPSFAIQDWAVDETDRKKYEAIFDSLGPIDGKLSGDKVKPVLINSGLSANVLGKIWELSDIDKDGFLDRLEMCVALHLVYRSLQNDSIPNALPPSLVPPGKRVRRESQTSRKGGSTQAGAVPVLPSSGSSHHRSRANSATSIDSLGVFGSPAAANSVSIKDQMMMSGSDFASSNVSRSLTSTPICPPALWLVDKSKYDQQFLGADTDQDGFVSGSDVKGVFMSSGLPQGLLAHIWTLADIHNTGKLNAEQFALALHLMNQKRDFNQDPPSFLTPDLIPPSFRPNPAGMTDTSTSTTQLEEQTMPIATTGNKEIDDLVQEIETLRNERRQVGSGVIQLEADMKVKQSEIKNLEIELNTLETTVKQLERQKGEAGRRLQDLDAQREAFERQLEDMKSKGQLEHGELQKLRTDAQMSAETAQTQEDALNMKRAELQSLRDEERRLDVELQNERAQLDTTNGQYGTLEADIQQVEKTQSDAQQQKRHLQQLLQRLENLSAAADWETIESEQNTLLATFKQFNLNSPQTQEPSHFSAVYETPPVAAGDYYDHVPDVDPFATVDPFAGHSEPFDDPFGNNRDVFDSSISSGGIRSPTKTKAAPPRPAPPKNRPITPKNDADPFGQSDPFASSTTGSSGGFANFADFSTFS